MQEETLSIVQIVVDTMLLVAMGISTPVLKKIRPIFHRGFFCNDEDLMHPMKGTSIVELKYFHPAGCLLNISVIILIEYLRHVKCNEKSKFFKFKIPKWLHNCYSILVTFTFGVLVTIFITTLIKGSVGRLRPFFFEDCQPSINCSLSENQHIYHINYECANKKFKQNTRLSFPSGHASFAMYCCLFLTIYIHKRMSFKKFYLFKNTLEIALMLTAFYIGISRVIDYKHFWGDVCAGYLIGGGCAILVSLNLYRLTLFNNKKEIL